MAKIEIINCVETCRDTDANSSVRTYTIKVLGHTYTIPNVEVPTYGTVKTEEDEITYVVSELLDQVEKLNKIKKLLA